MVTTRIGKQSTNHGLKTNKLENLWINDDCFNILPKIKDNTTQLLFTGIPDSNDLGMDKNLDGYEKFVDQCLDHFTRITKDTGFIGLCQSDRKMNGSVHSKHTKLINKMLEKGYILKDYKIILKRLMPNDYKDQFIFPYFHFCIFTKKGKIPRTGDWMRNILDYKMEKKFFFYVFPPEFIQLTIEFLSKENDLVVDPFAGTGGIVKVAKDMNRKYIGIELDKEIYNVGKTRMGRNI